MTERSGFERVRDYVVAQCQKSPGGVARVTNQEAGNAAGITGQAAGKHLQFLVLSGVLAMLRRSVYSVVLSDEVSEKFQNGFSRVSIETSMKPHVVPETAGEVSLEFQNSFNRVSKPPKDMIKEKEDDDEKEMSVDFVSEKWDDVFAFGVAVGDGILQVGRPAFADEIDQFIDWLNPNVQRAKAHVEAVFPTKCRGWSPALTNRIVFGVLYALNGFDNQTLKQKSIEAKESEKKHRFFETSIAQHHTPWRAGENPYCPDPWRIVAGHVKFWFKEAGIGWTATEQETKEQTKARGAKWRSRQKVLQQIPPLPGMENKPPLPPVSPAPSLPPQEQTAGPLASHYNPVFMRDFAKRNPTLYNSLCGRNESETEQATGNGPVSLQEIM